MTTTVRQIRKNKLSETRRLSEADARPQAISTYCTNLRAAPLADRMEAELGIPLLDTVSATFWGGLRAAGADPSQVQGWGSLFAMR